MCCVAIISMHAKSFFRHEMWRCVRKLSLLSQSIDMPIRNKLDGFLNLRVKMDLQARDRPFKSIQIRRIEHRDLATCVLMGFFLIDCKLVEIVEMTLLTILRLNYYKWSPYVQNMLWTGQDNKGEISIKGAVQYCNYNGCF